MSGGQLSLVVGLAGFAIYAGFLAAEAALLRGARKRLHMVIHVNGTRGKSTVTRMVHGILREAGFKAWGKTTGTEPRLLMPDGSEQLLRRLGPANVREQRNMLFRAVRGGADALVFECNAVRPELQLVSSAFLDPDLLVITNARLDHQSEQGDADATAHSFAATIPLGRALASSDKVYATLWEAEASRRSASFTFVDPVEGEGLGDLPENAACALAVADWLGLPRDKAAGAIRNYRADPGAFRLLRWTETGGGRVWFADALAANDPESTDRLASVAVDLALGEGMPAQAIPLLFVALRTDRPERTRLFVDYAIARCLAGARINLAAKPLYFEKAVFIGSIPRTERKRLERAGTPFSVTRAPAHPALAGTADSDAFHVTGFQDGGAVLILAAGNRGGSGRLVHAWAKKLAKGAGLES